MNNKNIILVTGGAGFIGSNYIINHLNKYTEDTIINLDKLTYSGNLENLADINSNSGYFFIKGDINDKGLLAEIFSGSYKKIPEPNKVIHFAAESHVDRSINDSSPFVVTNVLGTQNLLDVAKKFWNEDYADKRFIHVSTDEVYGELEEDGLFTEQTPLAPNSPYSASKAGSDLIARSYYQTFGIPVIITRCSNNYGYFQFPEKLIPLMINNIINKKHLPVYGKGLNVRDWLYVVDHCIAIDTVLEKGRVGEVYNIGGNNEWKNIDIVEEICFLIDKKLGHNFDSKSLITFVEDRLGHDFRYAIDNTKISTELGWQPSVTFDQGLSRTIDWYLNNQQWLNHVTSGDYQEYYQKFY